MSKSIRFIISVLAVIASQSSSTNAEAQLPVCEQPCFCPHIIDTSSVFTLSVFAADLDGDGDTDVLSSSANDDKIVWYENTDGLGTFGPLQVIATSSC